MPSPNFLVTVDVGPATALLLAVQERAADPSPVFLGPIKNSLDEFFQNQFDTSGAEGGYPWAPLTPATVESKARSGRASMGILRLTNRLWASLVKPTPGNYGISQVSRVVGSGGGQGATYERGTTVQGEGGAPYGYFHQHGYTVTRWGRALFQQAKLVPPRVLIPPEMPPAYVERWTASLQRYLADGVVE